MYWGVFVVDVLMVLLWVSLGEWIVLVIVDMVFVDFVGKL